MAIDVKSWENAESALFEKAVAALGGKVGKDAFAGYLPEGAPDVWMIGVGNPGLGDVGRFYGTVSSFDELTAEGIAEGQFSSREEGMAWAMGLMSMLAEQNNLKGVGNLTAVYMAVNHPDLPRPERQEDGSYLWIVTVPLQVIYKTNT